MSAIKRLYEKMREGFRNFQEAEAQQHYMEQERAYYEHLKNNGEDSRDNS